MNVTATKHEYVIRSTAADGHGEIYKHLKAREGPGPDPHKALDVLLTELYKRYPSRVFQVYRLVEDGQ